jgi:hypothetical protein
VSASDFENKGIFADITLRAEGPCAAFGVGWRQRADYVTVLDAVARVDVVTRETLEEIGSARVSTAWPTPGVDSAALAAKIERGLRNNLRVAGRPSHFTIEHVIERCEAVDTSNDGVFAGTSMQSFTCTGTATVSRDADLWARLPLRYQLLGINVATAISSYANSGGGGGASAMATEIRLRVIDDAERRICPH